jgi:hypothetical protein
VRETSFFLGMAPRIGSLREALSMDRCLALPTLFRMVPARFTLGSKLLYPISKAAALLEQPWTSMVRSTGTPKALATWDDDATSVPSRPS